MLGDIKKTMFDQFYRTQNLRHLMQEDGISKKSKQLMLQFKNVFDDRVTGTFYSDRSAFRSDLQNGDGVELNDSDQLYTDSLSKSLLRLLVKYFRNKKLENYQDRVQGMQHGVRYQRACVMRGLKYSTNGVSEGDSQVIICNPEGDSWYAARIVEIFSHMGNLEEGDQVVTYIVLWRYKPLNEEDSRLDQFCSFRGIGSKLFYEY